MTYCKCGSRRRFLWAVILFLVCQYLQRDLWASRLVLQEAFDDDDGSFDTAAVSPASWELSPSPIKKSHVEEKSHADMHKDNHALLAKHVPVAHIQAAIQPIWPSDNDASGTVRDRSKLLFVHVFKTAGSTLRSFLIQFAARFPTQDLSYATITSCTGATVESLANANKNWKTCKIKEQLSRKGHFDVFRDKMPLNNSYVEQKLDILAGHFRLGVLDYGSSHQLGKAGQHRYLTFFRNAAAKFVSGRVYVKTQKGGGKLTVDSMVHGITKELKDRERKEKKDYHTKSFSYLLTPEQEVTRHKEHWSIAQKVSAVKQNLVHYNVSIGIVEEMGQSMRILQHIMDPKGLLPQALFDNYERPQAALTTQQGKRRQTMTDGKSFNVSPISTSAILKRLKEDPTTYNRLLDYVRYEQELTDFALELHRRQYQSLRSHAS